MALAEQRCYGRAVVRLFRASLDAFLIEFPGSLLWLVLCIGIPWGIAHPGDGWATWAHAAVFIPLGVLLFVVTAGAMESSRSRYK
jgi:hypothetical protein